MDQSFFSSRNIFELLIETVSHIISLFPVTHATLHITITLTDEFSVVFLGNLDIPAGLSLQLPDDLCLGLLDLGPGSLDDHSQGAVLRLAQLDLRAHLLRDLLALAGLFGRIPDRLHAVRALIRCQSQSLKVEPI